MNIVQQVNILSPEFKANPFTLLARLRAEQPVCRVTLPDKPPVWLVTRYEDVKALLRDERWLARWLLLARDSTRDGAFNLTHEAMAQILGVSRSGVSLAADLLQMKGMIRSRCGQ